MLTVEIKDPELLLHVLETYMEGIKEAKEQSKDDTGTLDSMEKLLESMAQYDADLATLEQLSEEIHRGRTKSN